MPLNDRDYMRPNYPRSSGRAVRWRNWISLDPIIVIIVINLAVFIASLINRNQIIANLGLYPDAFTQRPWTLFTYMFVQVDFWQIFGNMLILFFFGRMVYRMMGGWRFNIIYFAGGIAGGLLYVLLGSYLPIVGAYGAVYALMGALVVIMPKLEVRIWFILPVPLWVVVLFSFILLTLPSFFVETLWQPFVGGLAVGAIAGLIYRYQMRHIIYR